MEVKSILKRFDDIANELKELEAALVVAITKAINEVSKENPHKIRQVSKNIFIINSSELLGNPWNPSYYDWEASGKVVLEYLQGKDVKKWKSLLQEKLDKGKGKTVEFEKKAYCSGYVYTNKTPIERAFIEKIVSKL